MLKKIILIITLIINNFCFSQDSVFLNSNFSYNFENILLKDSIVGLMNVFYWIDKKTNLPYTGILKISGKDKFSSNFYIEKGILYRKDFVYGNSLDLELFSDTIYRKIHIKNGLLLNVNLIILGDKGNEELTIKRKGNKLEFTHCYYDVKKQKFIKNKIKSNDFRFFEFCINKFLLEEYSYFIGSNYQYLLQPPSTPTDPTAPAPSK